MRHLALLALVLLACSDSTDPEDFRPAPGTYDLTLTACRSCDELNTPGFALAWKDGVAATVEVSGVTGDGASGEYLELVTAQGSDLFDLLESAEFTLTRTSAGRYAGSVGYTSGSIRLILEDGGCDFVLSYPGVDTGGGTCEVR